MNRKALAMNVQRMLRSIGALLLLLFATAGSAGAELAAVGPVDPVDHFPAWYQDLPGTRLELCLDGDGLTGPCIFDPVNPADPISVATGFGAEAFYWYADTTMVGAGAVDALLVLGLEAAYATGDPSAGNQITFGRVRVRVSGLPRDGVYTVIHPFGSLAFNVVLDPLGKRDINFTTDIGIGPFEGALRSDIGPFLRWAGPDVTDPARPYVDPLTSIAYLGNPQVPHTVTGSPFGTNFFMIVGPAGAILNPVTGTNILSTNLFTLAGKPATRVGATIDRAAYQRDAAGAGFVDVFASSLPGQTLQVTGVGPAVTMVEEPGAGRYYARLLYDGTVIPLPANVTVTNTGDVPVRPVTAAVTDTVWALNTFNTVTTTLSFTAFSSDLAAPQVFTSPDAPPFLGPGVVAPPPSLTVSSAPGGGSDTEPVIVQALNRAPVITSTPVTAAIVGHPYRYQVVATDDPGSTLTYALVTGPAGMTMDAAGLVAWIPPAALVLPYPYTADVTVSVTDEGGLSASQPFVISVGENFGPQIGSLPVTAGLIGQPYAYQVVATDANPGDVLTYSLDVAPAGMAIGATGLVSWLPSVQGDAAVTVRVTDPGGLFATQSFLVGVPNAAPAITSAPLTAIFTTQVYSYQVVAADSLGDILTYSLDVAPAGMAIDAAGLVTWTPPGVGIVPVTVRVTDQGALFAIQSFNISVTVQNFPPVITSAAPTSGIVGQALTYALTATDTVGDVLTYSLDVAPAGMTVSAAGLIAYTPAAAGSFPVTARVTDQGGLFATQSFTLAVAAPNTAPVITSVPPTVASIGRQYRFQMTASDAPGSTLVFSLGAGPAGMSITAAGLITWTPTVPLLATVVVRVTDQGGLSSSYAYQIVARREDLKITRAEYSRTRQTWAITGTDNLPGNTITLRAGGATGPVIASVVVRADSTWSFTGAGAVAPSGATKVTAVSTTGLTATASLNIR